MGALKDTDGVEVHAIVHGIVQGVAFRHTTQVNAKRMGIVGTVRNLPEGSVEIYAQGTQNKLDALLEKLTGSEGPGKVHKVDKNFSPAKKTYEGFQILF